MKDRPEFYGKLKKTVEDIDRMMLTAFSADYSSEKKVFHERETQ